MGERSGRPRPVSDIELEERLDRLEATLDDLVQRYVRWARSEGIDAKITADGGLKFND